MKRKLVEQFENSLGKGKVQESKEMLGTAEKLTLRKAKRLSVSRECQESRATGLRDKSHNVASVKRQRFPRPDQEITLTSGDGWRTPVPRPPSQELRNLHFLHRHVTLVQLRLWYLRPTQECY